MIKHFLRQDNKTALFLNCISFGTIFVTFAVLGLVMFWLLMPYTPLVINQRPIEIITKSVEKGGFLLYKLDYCKYTEKEAVVRTDFKDGILFSLPDITDKSVPGCKVQVVGQMVPETLPKGDYILTLDFVYEVNPIRTITVETHSQKFRVVENKNGVE